MEPHAGAVQVFHFDAENKLCLNDTIFEILNHQEIANKKVCVVSIAGAFRQGKSFIQNFLIRYLKFRYKMKTQDISHWLDPKHGPISGFAFRSGPAPHTVGILMWSEIFLANLPSGEEVAIILLDTQGTFDNSNTVTDSATIFALSTLISSVQIYNLKENIRQDDLQHLKYFLGYGQLALDTESKTPFQKLLFLIRDWQFFEHKNFGFKGGEELLNEALNTEKNKSEELIMLKTSIKKSFKDVGCFLMPYPGKKVASSRLFQGNIDEIDSDFVTHVKIFGSAILAPENIIPKTVNAQTIRVKDLFGLMRTYSTCFKDGKLPPINSLYLATAQIHHTAAMQEAVDEYKKEMEHCTLQEEAKSIMTRVLKAFDERKKMGSNTMSEKYKERLTKDLEELFSKNYKNVIDKYYYTTAKQQAIDEYKKQMEHCKLQEDADKCKVQVLEMFSQRKKKESCTMGKKYEELLIKELEELFCKNYKNVIEEYYYTTAMQKAIDEYKKQMEHCKLQEEADKLKIKVLEMFRQRKKMESSTLSKKYKQLLIKQIEELFAKNYKNVIDKYYYTTAMQKAIDEYKRQMEHCKLQEDANKFKTRVLEMFRQRKKEESSTMFKKYEELLIKELENLFCKNYKNVIEECYYTTAMQKAIDEYKKRMEHCKLQEDANKFKTRVLEIFRQRKKEESSTMFKRYEELLIKELEELFCKNYKNGMEEHYYTTAMQEAIYEYKKQMEHCKLQEDANKFKTRVLEIFRQRKKEESSTMSKKYEELLIQQLEELFSKNYKKGIEKYYYTTAKEEAIDEYKKQMKHCKLHEDANKFKIQVLKMFREKEKLDSSKMSKTFEELLIKEIEELFTNNYKNVIDTCYYTAAMQEAIDDYKKQMENCKSQEEAKSIMTQALTAFHQRKKMESNAMGEEYKERLTKELEVLFFKNYKNGIEKHEEDYYNAGMQEAIDDYKNQMEKCRSQEEANNIMSQVLKAFRQRKKEGNNTMSKEYKRRLTKELEVLFKNYKQEIEISHFTAAMQEAEDEYNNRMKNCESKEEAENIKTQVLKAFDQKNKMESDKMSEEYKEILTKKLEELYSKNYENAWDNFKENVVRPGVEVGNAGGAIAGALAGAGVAMAAIVAGAGAAEVAVLTAVAGTVTGGVVFVVAGGVAVANGAYRWLKK